jgi:hypothetical protein
MISLSRHCLPIGAHSRHHAPPRQSMDDEEQALELWRALDPVSKRWYVSDPSAREFVELPLTQADFDSMGVREGTDDQRRHRRLPLKPALLSDAIPRRAAP